MKKVILIIIDGLGDETAEQLGGTPLEYIAPKAETFNMFAENGLCGLLYPIAPGVAPASDTGHLSIFGYDIRKEYPGRGYFEALGANIKPKPNQIAFRTNLASVIPKNKELIVIDRRAGRISGEEAEELYRALDEKLSENGFPAKIIHTLEHRGVLVIEGDEYLGAVTDTDPHEVGVPICASEPWERLSPSEREMAERTANILNEITKLAYDVLNKHPINKMREERGLPKANVILIRGGGISKTIMSFREKWGFKAAFVAAGALYKGVARALGMDEIHVEGATGTPKTNLNGKVEGALRALDKGYDFVFLHIKAADNLSHDKKPLEKADFLLRINHALKPILGLEDTVVVITGDHTTSSIRGRHMGLPVPMVIWSKEEMRRDRVKKFCESACAEGGLGVLRGHDLMQLILDLSDRSVEYGTYPSKSKLVLSVF